MSYSHNSPGVAGLNPPSEMMMPMRVVASFLDPSGDLAGSQHARILCSALMTAVLHGGHETGCHSVAPRSSPNQLPFIP